MVEVAMIGRARSRSNRAQMAVIAARKRPNARIRSAVRRAFILSNNEPITGRAVLERAFPRLKRFKHWHRWSARRALLQVAVVVARHRYGRGRPCLWAVADYAHLSRSKKSTAKSS